MGMTFVYPALTSESSTAKQVPGAVYEDEKTGKVYKYVKAGAAITMDTASQLACALKVDESQATDNVVLMTTNAGEVIAGVSNSAITSGDYFWMQTKGVVTDAAVSSGSAGDPLVSHTTNGMFAVSANTDVGNIKAQLLENVASSLADIELL